MPQSAREKAIHASKHPSTSHDDKFKLLAKTSGKMGMKQGIDFEIFGGKPVTLKEKEHLLKQKEMKEKGKMKK